VRLASETLAEMRARGVAVTDVDGRVIASAGGWPTDIAARVIIEGGRGPGAAVLVGPRVDGRPHSRRSIDALAEVAGLADNVAGDQTASATVTTSVDIVDLENRFETADEARSPEGLSASPESA
jgi:hypothetical protein